jgi:hypothetical protein
MIRIIHYIACVVAISTNTFAQLYSLRDAISYNRYTYVLKIRTPSDVQRLHGWRFLYKGDLLLPHSNLVKIIEKRCIFSLSLIITPEIRCRNSTVLSSLRHLELEPDQPVRWFNMHLIFDKGLWKWEILEINSQEIPRTLPHHVIIFLYNPFLVKSLEKPYKTSYSLDNAHEGGQCTFELPTIVLEGSKEDLENALNYSQHASPTILAYHRPSPCIMQVIEGVHCIVDAS